MKRIVAVADTHLGSWNLPEKLVELIENADFVIHAGDFHSYSIYKKFADYSLYAVYGNSDEDKIKEELVEEIVFEIEGVKFGLIHKGNYINQFHDLGYKAMEMNADVLVFGHLHRFVLEEIKGRIIVCPGSPTRPRLSAASCAEIIVDGRRVDIKYHVVQPLFCGMEVFERMRGCL